MANTLRIPPTSFVGRDVELDDLERLLARTRLLTITGTGGSGKTRLAVKLTQRLAGRFPSGVFQVDLASLREPDLVAGVALASVGRREVASSDPVETLADFLRDRTALLLVDNCEQVAEACAALLVHILAEAPDVKVIATSRRRLGVAGETSWTVPPLSLPAPAAIAGANLLEYSAVALFVDRAQSSDPTFTVTPANAGAVLTICRRLDGMPLAIELAAARISVLTPQEIDARLNDRFRLLTAAGALAVERHQTLRAALDWSYELLLPDARALWNRISVFRGGAGLEAIERVCGAPPPSGTDMLDLVAKLVDSSVVTVDRRTKEARYGLLETVREYGVDRLAEAGETEGVRERHGAWVAGLVRQAEPQWRGPNQKAWLDRMELELDNIRAALEWCKSRSRDDLILEIATGLWFLWSVRGHMSEGRRWLETGLAMTEAATPLRARALNDAGFLAYHQGDSQLSLPLLRESVRVARETGDEGTIAYSGARLGIGLLFNGDLAEARAQLEGSYDRYRALDDEVGVYLAAYELAEVLSALGEHERSEALHHKSLALKEARGDRWHIAYSLFGLGLLRWRRGASREAVELLVEALQIRDSLDARQDVATTLEAIAWVVGDLGMARDAATLLGAAAALESTVRASLSAHHRPDHDRTVELLTRALGREPFQELFARGASLEAEAAVEFAIQLRQRVLAAQPVKAVLTARERRVALMVAEGMSNREIATQLVISERTAESHVEHIRNKLGFHSRTQIAAWAADQGLTRPAQQS